MLEIPQYVRKTPPFKRHKRSTHGLLFSYFSLRPRHSHRCIFPITASQSFFFTVTLSQHQYLIDYFISSLSCLFAFYANFRVSKPSFFLVVYYSFLSPLNSAPQSLPKHSACKANQFSSPQRLYSTFGLYVRFHRRNPFASPFQTSVAA